MASKPGRKLMSWTKSLDRACAKMLAHVIMTREKVGGGKSGEHRLWNRLVHLYPTVTELVLGHRLEWSTVRSAMEKEYGVPVTPHKLYDRAHKTGYANEFIPTVYESVEAAYVQAVTGRDPRRVFTKAQKKVMLRQQGSRCKICGADLDWVRSEADHKQPWSKGGRTTPDNGQIICIRCHREKTKLGMNHLEYAAYYEKKYGYHGDRNEH